MRGNEAKMSDPDRAECGNPSATSRLVSIQSLRRLR